jgi:hypothetical protein
MRALTCQPVDRVAAFQWEISRNVIEALTPGADVFEFVDRMGIDSMVVHPFLIEQRTLQRKTRKLHAGYVI